MSAARTGFDHETTASQVVEGIDLAGRVAIVTGASGGLGEETARALASRGAAVTLAVRDVAKGEAVAASIRKSTDNPAIDVGEIELSRPASVRAFAQRFLADHPALHILVNNAGVMACPLARTPEGWEIQFATNHLGHFLLTCLLEPALVAGAPARVVNLSSAGHRFSPVVLDDPNFERRDYDKWSAYGQAKTANILFSLELNRRLAPVGVTANAVHPGGIRTDLGRHLSPEDIQELLARQPAGGGIRWKEVPAGAATSVWAATTPELEGRGGLYLEDCHVAEQKISSDVSEGYEAWALDPDAARGLWTLSEKLLGESFDF